MAGQQKKSSRRKVQKKRLTGVKVNINDFNVRDLIPVFILIGLIGLVLAGGLSWFLGKKSHARNAQIARERRAIEMEAVVKAGEKTDRSRDEVVITSYLLRDKVLEGARNVMENFIKAKTSEEASFWVIDGGAEFRKVFQPVSKVNIVRKILALEYTDGSKYVVYNLSTDEGLNEIHLLAKEGEEFKVDWRTFFYYGTVPFQDCVESKGVEDVFCLMVLSDYYETNYEERKYQSFALTQHDAKETIYAYVERSTYMDDMLADAFLVTPLKIGKKKAARVKLTVRAIEKSYLPAVEITNVLAVDWVSHLQERN